MLWLKRIFGKDYRFFDLLEAGAEEAKASVGYFSEYLSTREAGGSERKLDELIHARRKEKRIRQEVIEALSRTFVTPLDREDIESLSFALYRVPKQMEKIVERMSICPGTLPIAGFRRQAELLTLASESVVFMVKQLRHGADIVRIREANERLQFAEGEADKVMLELLRQLYQGDHPAKEMLMLRELYEMVEQAVDRCRNVGNAVLQIALKNS
jgi:uncharacterized protein Yka (UPF0111/DUF47 family)